MSKNNFARSAFLTEGIGREIPEDDPNHEHYLKFCFVCKEEAKPGQVSVTTMTNVAKSLTIYIENIFFLYRCKMV